MDKSSLQELARGTCHAAKLDHRFVQRIGEEPEIEKLVRSLIGAARSFGLNVLAEGVERAEQAQFLLANGCTDVQGFLLGRPAAARDLAAIVAKDLRKKVAEAQHELVAQAAPERLRA
jgi:EAL domain-containing protein (putative c-di-GMP-specific phosphodiesterase class I)